MLEHSFTAGGNIITTIFLDRFLANISKAFKMCVSFDPDTPLSLLGMYYKEIIIVMCTDSFTKMLTMFFTIKVI